MKICNKCNHQASDDAKFCPVCGNSFEEKINENQNNSTDTSSSNYSYYNFDAMSTPPVQESEDKSSVGFGILCFFFPIVGLILFLVWKNDYPKKAKSCGIGALIGVIANIVLSICYAIFLITLMNM